MAIYIQYDPSQVDEYNHVYFSAVSIPDNSDPLKNIAAPVVELPIVQIAFADGTIINNKILDLSFNPPILITAPVPSPNPLPGG